MGLTGERLLVLGGSDRRFVFAAGQGRDIPVVMDAAAAVEEPLLVTHGDGGRGALGHEAVIAAGGAQRDHVRSVLRAVPVDAVVTPRQLQRDGVRHIVDHQQQPQVVVGDTPGGQAVVLVIEVVGLVRGEDQHGFGPVDGIIALKLVNQTRRIGGTARVVGSHRREPVFEVWVRREPWRVGATIDDVLFCDGVVCDHLHVAAPVLADRVAGVGGPIYAGGRECDAQAEAVAEPLFAFLGHVGAGPRAVVDHLEAAGRILVQRIAQHRRRVGPCVQLFAVSEQHVGLLALIQDAVQQRFFPVQAVFALRVEQATLALSLAVTFGLKVEVLVPALEELIGGVVLDAVVAGAEVDLPFPRLVLLEQRVARVFHRLVLDAADVADLLNHPVVEEELLLVVDSGELRLRSVEATVDGHLFLRYNIISRSAPPAIRARRPAPRSPRRCLLC